jgi:hypothetical protein
VDVSPCYLHFLVHSNVKIVEDKYVPKFGIKVMKTESVPRISGLLGVNLSFFDDVTVFSARDNPEIVS